MEGKDRSYQQALRAYEILSRVNQATTAVSDERTLLQKVCQVAVTSAGYRIAWIGKPVPEKAYTLAPEAVAHYQQGAEWTLSSSRMTLVPRQSPAAEALRTGQPCVVPDIRQDERFFHLREEAQRHGHAAVAAFPLYTANDEFFGIFEIVSDEPSAFGKDEIEILQEVADDLTYGIGYLHIQRQRQREQALLRMAERVADIGAWEWYVPADEWTLSPNMQTILGTQKNQINWRDLMSLVYPPDRGEVRRIFLQAMKDYNDFQATFRVTAEQGASQEKTIHLRGEVSQDSDGRNLKMYGAVQDITAHREAEKALRESEEKHRRLFETSKDAMFVLDPSTKTVTSANAACVQMFRCSDEGELINATPWDFSPERQPDGVRSVEKAKEYCDIAMNEGSHFFEWVHKRTDGEEFTTTVLLTSFSLQGESFIQATVRDVTDQKQAQQRIVKQRERLRQLTAQLANAQDEEQRRISEGLHDDVAQILAAASGKLAMARGRENAAELEKLHKEIDDLVKEANEKIRDLSFELTSSTLQNLGLYKAVEELCTNMQERHGVRFRMRGDSYTKPIAEPAATIVFKAVREFMFNAVKHAEANEGAVWIRHTGNMLKVAVEDNGSGFPTRIDSEETDQREGLGLFGIRQRLWDLGGRLWIESEPGEGTCVTLWVPLENCNDEEENSAGFDEKLSEVYP